MASTKKKKKILGKDELRRLMKQKQTTLKQTSRIEHAYAKYNCLNQLVCVVCNATLKSDHLWTAHLQSRLHKETLAAKSVVGPVIPQGLKRAKAVAEVSTSDKKKVKVGQNGTGGKSGLPTDFFDKSSSSKAPPPSSSLLADYGSSDDSEEDEDEDPTPKVPRIAATTSGAVPPGFFDMAAKPSGETTEEKPKTIADVLPEGFFDDPKMDAKVRKVEYRDKMEEEWEQFQRAMKEEAHVSEVIIDEDDEQANLERNIDEIDDQMNRWKEIEDLHDKKAEVVGKKVSEGGSDSDADSDVSLEDAGLDMLFDWRAKKTWK